MNVGEELDAHFGEHLRGERPERAPELQRLLDRALTRDGLARIALDKGEPADDRRSAVWALGALRDRNDLGRLIPLISDGSEPKGLRGDVVLALAGWDSDRVVAVLRETLATETDEDLRCYAASSLGFGEPGAFVDDLVAILNDRSQSSQVRGHAAEAFGHLYGSSETLAPRAALRAVRAAILEDDDILRWDAVFALGMIGGRNDLVLLKRILTSELARETPNPRIVEETEEMIESMRGRRDRRWR